MNDFSIEKPVPYYEQFYHSIKKMIFEGKFKPGERIIENKLAKEFNVSKSPIRQAIRILEKEGLLVLDDKSRLIVYKPTLKDVEEIYFCRMALESFAVEFITKIVKDDELEHIENVLLETENAIINSLEDVKIIGLNVLFHNLIIKYTLNNRLKKQLDDLKSLTYYFRILNFQGENRAVSILNQHREIFNHIKNRDEKKASKAMRAHLQLDLDHLIEVLSKQVEPDSNGD